MVGSNGDQHYKYQDVDDSQDETCPGHATVPRATVGPVEPHATEDDGQRAKDEAEDEQADDSADKCRDSHAVRTATGDWFSCPGTTPGVHARHPYSLFPA